MLGRHHSRLGSIREYLVLIIVVAAAAGVFLVTWNGSPVLKTEPPSDKPRSATPPVPTPSADRSAIDAPKSTATPEKPDAKAETPVSLRFGRKEPIARTPGCIRVMTFNLENLFDDKDDPALTGKNDDKDNTKPAEACRAAAEAIKRCDPDVVALQEVESYDALIQFRDTYLKDAGYEHVVSIDTGDARGIECSVLSRLPLKDTKVYTNMPLGGEHPAMTGTRANEFAGQPVVFKRSPLRVTVEVSAEKVASLAKAAGEEIKDAKAYQLTLFVVHMKSGQFDYWREKEAAKTAELAKEMLTTNAGANILILGDCNAMLRDEALKIYERAGFKDLFKDRSAKDNEVITHSSGRIIDHIFYNSNAEHELQVASRYVLAMPTRPEGYHWRTTPPAKGTASDHFPVVVDFKPVD